jgi:hypothetical protein
MFVETLIQRLACGDTFLFEPELVSPGWEKNFVESLATQLSSGNTLTEKQAALSIRLLKKYQIPLEAFFKTKIDLDNPVFAHPFRKLFIEKTLLQEYVDLTKSTKTKEDSDESIHKENFIKFLSDSRDWAFSYIESVQKGLTKFVSDVDADVSHFDEYGDALSMSRPDYPSMKNISKAYKELKTLLPEDEIK